MNSKVENPKSGAPRGGTSGIDVAKYVAALLLVVAGLIVWWYFAGQWATPLRSLAVVAGLVAGAAVFLGTAKGRDTREFLSESRFELRKVVWPTRQETWRMTWVVMIAVTILSLILFGFDLIIKTAVEWFLNTGRP